MPTFRFPKPVEVQGLGVESDAMPWLGGCAGDQLANEVSRARLKVEEGDDVVTLSSGALASAEAIRGFVTESDCVSGDVVGVLSGEVGRWGESPCFGSVARLYRLRNGGDLTESRAQNCTKVHISNQPRRFEVELANGPRVMTREMWLSNEVLLSTHHYSGVLWSNLLGLGPYLYRHLVGPTPIGLARVVWASLRSLSVQPDQLAGRLNKFGKKTKIHPSAVVEASVVGEGCSIGPNAVVRSSVLMDGARVEAGALLHCSVMGRSSIIQRHGWAQYSVIGDNAAVGGAMQLGVLAPGASIKFGAILMDQAVPDGVKTFIGDELVEVPLGMLGVGVGMSTMIGSGVKVAPGRVVPPNITLLPGDGSVCAKIDPLSSPTGGVLSVRQGTAALR